MKILFLFLSILLFSVSSSEAIIDRNPNTGRFLPPSLVTDPDIIGFTARIMSGRSFVCSGVLITPIHVLTAGHCFDDESNLNNLNVKIGGAEYDDGTIRTVDTVDINPYFNNVVAETIIQNDQHDMAVLTLNRPVSNKPIRVHLTEYPLSDDRVNLDIAQFIGWGFTNFGLAPDLPFGNTEVLYADNQFQNPSVANSYYGLQVSWNQDSFARSGDSGGPIIIWDERNSEWVLLGIISRTTILARISTVNPKVTNFSNSILLNKYLNIGDVQTSSNDDMCGVDEQCTVFTTSAIVSGNMNEQLTGKRGVKAADMLCSSAAYDAGLEGSYLSWISTNRINDPITRFDFSPVPYVRTDGTQIAFDSIDLLLQNGLLSPINTDEFGDSLANSSTNTVWTNVKDSGVSVNLPARENCNGWINRSNTRLGNNGDINSSAETTWTDSGTASCGNDGRLYCMEQDGATAGPAFIEWSGEVIIEAENFNLYIEGDSDVWRFEDSIEGYSGSGYMQAGNDFNNFYSHINIFNGAELVYDVYFQTKGTYYVWVRGCGITGKDDSVHMGLDRSLSSTSSNMRLKQRCTSFEWRNQTFPDAGRPTFNVTTTGRHKINLWVREDGAKVDKILLTTDKSFKPTDND